MYAIPRVLWSALLLTVIYLPELTNADKSTCEICRDSGNCLTAYQGSPGQYCGAWLDRASQRRACCCPTHSVCKLSNYACNCEKEVATTKSSGRFVYILVGLIGLALVAGVAFFLWKRFSSGSSGSYEQNAAPMYAQQTPQAQYAQPGGYPGAPGYPGAAGYPAAPGYAPAAPGYAPAYGPGPAMNTRGGGMSTGAAVAAGALGGLAGGVLLSEALDGGHNDDHGHDYNGGDGGGYGDNGGGDFAGDF